MDIPVTLNVKSANVIPVINCMQGDTPTLICTIMNGNVPFIADSGEFDLCVCEGETAKHKAVSIKCIVNKNTVTVNLTKNETDEAGDLKLCISFSNTAQEIVVSTFPFILKATENPAYSAVGQKENIKALTDYVAEAKKYADVARNSGENISEYVDSAKKYAESAAESVTSVENAEKLARSYATGDSGVREGEATDNSKFYSEKSAESKRSAEEAANIARQKAEEASDSAENLSESVASAENAEKLARSYAAGNSGIREGETTDNSKYYSEKAKEYAEQAKAIASGDFISSAEKGIAGGVATLNDDLAVEKAVADKIGNDILQTYAAKTEIPALIKVDGSTITKDEDGTLHNSASIDVDAELSASSTNPVQNKAVKKALDDTRDNIETLEKNKADKTDMDNLNKDIIQMDKNIETLKKSVSDGKTKVAAAVTEKGVETAADATFDTIAENIKKIETGGGELHGAVISVSTEEENLICKEVNLIKDNTTVQNTVFDSNGACSFTIQETGDYTISSSDGTDSTTAIVNVTVDNIINKTILSVQLSFLKIVTFADGTYKEIVAMIKAHYANKINIADYWSVGDVTEMYIHAMEATYVGETHISGLYKFAIADFEHDELTTPVNGHTKAAVTLTQVDCLMDIKNRNDPTNGNTNTENGFMNSSSSNSGGWEKCSRRSWCKNTYYYALPSEIADAVKEVNKKTSAGGGTSSTIVTTADKVFLLAEIEIFGSRSYSVAGEGTQYQYYKNATANRYKLPRASSSSNSSYYWQRSPHAGYSTNFCFVNNSGSASKMNANDTNGLAPCFCL